jgi:hypothetical protein
VYVGHRRRVRGSGGLGADWFVQRPLMIAPQGLGAV